MDRTVEPLRRGAGALLALTLALVPLSAAGGTAAAAVPDRAAAASPAGRVAVQWRLDAATAALRRPVPVRLRLQSPAALHDVVLTLSTDGPVEVVGDTRTGLAPLAAAAVVERPVVLRVTGTGTATVRATLTGRDAAGRSSRGAVDLDVAATARGAALSRSGLLDAQSAALRLETPAGAPYDARLDALRTGGASEQATTAPPSTDGAAAGTTAVSGRVRYTDSAGGLHPARTLVVQVRDADGTATGTLLATVRTDVQGRYAATVGTVRPGGTARRLVVRVLAQGTGFTVQGAGATTPHALTSTPRTATGAAQTVDLTANRTADNNTAFAVADALTTAVAYTRRVNGGALLVPLITASFPDPAGTDFNSGTGVARILELDRFDWDVLLHEYGHAVSAKLGFDASPGGAHSFTENLGESRGKLGGTRLAWSEGFATWFALTAESATGVAALGVPKAGDAFYDDTEDASLHVPLAADTPFASLGEDNELSVARTLWHVVKDAPIALSDTTVVSTLRSSGATTLSSAVKALLPAAGAARFDDSDPIAATRVKKSDAVACLLVRQQVSPELTAPAAGTALAQDTPPTFAWTPHGAGPSHRLDSFTVQFWSPAWDARLFESPTLTTPTWTPSAAQWKAVLAAKDAQGRLPASLQVVVKGTGTDAPTSGPYKSCGVSVKVTPGLTAVPASTFLASQSSSPACSGQFPADIDEMVVNASRLRPSTTYALRFSLPSTGYPDTPLPTITSDADGAVTDVHVAIPLVPAHPAWPLLATPPSGSGAPVAKTQVKVGAYTCIAYSSSSPDFTVAWGGVGLAPGSTATQSWNGVAAGTLTASPRGAYSGSYGLHCPASSNTVSVDAQLLSGAVHFVYPQSFACVTGPGAGRAAVVLTG